ncbi:MAG: PspC domain-containing protein, partial [archaeon]
MAKNSGPVKRLYRSESNRVLAGVCGGIGEYFGIDPVLVRMIFLLFVFVGGGGIPLYFILWLIVPTESKVRSEPRDAIRENAREMQARFRQVSDKSGLRGPAIFGLFLVAFGVIFLVYESGCCQAFLNWGKLWPFVLILIG